MENELISLRKELHKHPEVSGGEKHTAERIASFIRRFEPSQIIEGLGGHGLAAIYQWGNGLPPVSIRCELDALPIQEVNSFAHVSIHDEVSHKCGHDGHMTMVAGLCPWLKDANFNNGSVVLLFQPAEEIGVGAQSVINDKKFDQLSPDFSVALHNIPGRPMHEVILPQKSFWLFIMCHCEWTDRGEPNQSFSHAQKWNV